MVFGDKNWGKLNCGDGCDGCASCNAPTDDVVSDDSLYLLKRKAVLEGQFMLIVSHKMMGCQCDMDKADYDEMIKDLVNAAA